MTPDEWRSRVGQEAATSGWFTVTQLHIDRFADATGDDQWIHVDPVRAAASPFGGTIAHGFLTLSLLASLMRESVSIEGVKTAVNYGLNRVRFIAPVRAGSRIRARFTPAAVEEVAGGAQITWNITVDLEGHEKPACTAEWIVRYLHA